MAWHPLGWQAAWLAEVDRAASEVLAHRFPHVVNHGDMTQLPGMVDRREIEAPDALVGGTPCQAFSVAGRREGLADERGQLTLAYVDLADAIDRVRVADGEQPCIIVWENVPGVLSSKDNAFGCFLAGLAGEDLPLEPPGKKWGNAGVVLGPQRAVAWRTLDAQWFGLAQRRRRVFVVASAREGFDPAGILFEFEGVRRDTAPSREAGQNVAGTLDARTDGGGFPGTDGACAGHVVPVDGRLRQSAVSWPAEIACTLNASFGSKMGLEDQHINGGVHYSYLPTVSMCLNAGGMGRRDAESETLIPTNRCGFDDAPIAFTAKDYGGVATVDCSPTLRSMGHTDSHANGGGQVGVCYGLTTEQTPKFNEDCALTLTKQSPSGGGQPQAVAYSVALRGRDGGATAELGDDVAGCLRASGGGGDKPHVLTVVPFDTTQITSPGNYSNPKAGDTGHPLAAGAHPPAVCVTSPVTHTLKAEGFDASEDGTGRGQPIVPCNFQSSQSGVRLNDTVGTLDANYGSRRHNGVIDATMAVRRLMPVECERLQGFPDGWTKVPVRKVSPQNQEKARRDPGSMFVEIDGVMWTLAADGPRYKQLGNSMAVNVMRWIGFRIADAIRPRGHNGGPPLDDFDSLLVDDFEDFL